ncbi:MAG: hypothetical protein EZS28_039369 [Streblomastix strix]|uniref:Uncharacterized protein n=1 Tax=Streblomastix strix TaxID=222440 RepID=A0A5J4U439_9EUKA|nr:MAG: hypothetical protein EZS28_039369 [Streblomastix strix]
MHVLSQGDFKNNLVRLRGISFYTQSNVHLVIKNAAINVMASLSHSVQDQNDQHENIQGERIGEQQIKGKKPQILSFSPLLPSTGLRIPQKLIEDVPAFDDALATAILSKTVESQIGQNSCLNIYDREVPRSFRAMQTPLSFGVTSAARSFVEVRRENMHKGTSQQRTGEDRIEAILLLESRFQGTTEDKKNS